MERRIASTSGCLRPGSYLAPTTTVLQYGLRTSQYLCLGRFKYPIQNNASYNEQKANRCPGIKY